jgi:hypothetical protein
MDSVVDFIAGIIKLIIFLAIVMAVIVFLGYNKIRRLAENVKEAWSNITVVTRRKVSLVNQLIDVVRGYQESEKLVMLKISDDLSVAMMQQAYQQSGTVLSTINGMAQRFPELKANEQYHRLADSIQQSEVAVEVARTHYNQAVKEYNVARTSIPLVFYAHLIGFRAAQYLNLDAVESPDSAAQKPMVSDDGERVNQLLGMAGSKVRDAAKNIAQQGKMLAEKGVARVQHEPKAEFHYLDAAKSPKGPISRSDLDALFQSGAINAQTDILKVGTSGWSKYQDLMNETTSGDPTTACGSCRQPIPAGVKFCLNCGAASGTATPTVTARSLCPSCGAESPGSAKFCKECGHSV